MIKKSILLTTLVLLLTSGRSHLYSEDLQQDIIPEDNIETSNESTDFDDFQYDFEEEKIFKIKGHFKNLFTYTRTGQYSEYLFSLTNNRNREKYLIANVSRIRLSPEINYSDFLHVRVDYDNEIIIGNYLKTREFDLYWRPSEYNDLIDLSGEPVYNDDLLYRTKIHRAYAKIVLRDFTLTIGRQQIRFGSGRLWNPLDILNPISPTFVEGVSEQKGTDAIRLEYYPTDIMEIALVLDQKSENDKLSDIRVKNSNVISRFKMTIDETDIAALGGRISRRNIGGSDISSVFFDGLLRGSLMYSDPEDDDPYIQGSTGYEYNFKIGLYFLVEYFYNQNGINFNSSLESAYLNSYFFGINENNYYQLANQFLTFNQHYTGIAAGYDLTPLLRAELFSIYDFQGRGIFAMPSLRYNLFENFDICAGIMSAYIIGSPGKVSDFDDLSKFPYVFASLTWYF